MTLRVKDVHFAYGKHDVLEKIGFEAVSGSLAAILGENGSGKTTLLKNINRILKPQNGSVLIDDKAVARMTRAIIARHFGYVSQRSQSVHCTVFEAVLLGRMVRTDGGPGSSDEEKVRDILALLHLDDLAMRYTTEISGGELQRVVIARALAQEPRVLLLDEPINHLDPINQIEVMSLIHSVTKEMNITSLLVTHDLNSALRFADKFILLKNRTVFASGGKEIITPKTVEAVFHIETIIQEIADIPVVVPLIKK